MPLTDRTVAYRLFEEHFERYAREYEERYEARGGVARRGFARIRCPNCRAEHVITEILKPVPHRHVLLTVPRILRGLFQRDRREDGPAVLRRCDLVSPSVWLIV